MKKTSQIQKLALLYCFLFLGIFLLNYIPFIHDAEGKMFGLFRLGFMANALHIFSALWAGSASLISRHQAVIYFKVFGIFYLLDGFICTLFQQCPLDFTIVTKASQIHFVTSTTFLPRLPLNIPHIFLGGLAIYIGFILSKKLIEE